MNPTIRSLTAILALYSVASLCGVLIGVSAAAVTSALGYGFTGHEALFAVMGGVAAIEAARRTAGLAS